MAEQINKINESLYQANIDLVDKNKKLESEIEKLKQRLEIEIDISDGMLKTIDRIEELMNEYRYTKVEEYGKIIEFFKKLKDILKGVNNDE